ncbi:hypothetical protein CPC08DRAFT_647094 [Agrocybe pediades]|nr:hypothetical protein CPC08DRAFT_647094 [Agrocybe pediades]
MKPPVRLDVEDEDARQARLQSFFEKLNSSSDTRFLDRTAEMNPQFPLGERRTFPIEPPTELLSRVQAFLPQLEASNAILMQRAQQDPKSVDIEHISEGMDRHIEMNLGLGVFEDRSQRPAGQQDEDSEMSTSSSSESSDSDKDDDNNDADDDSGDSDASSEIITSFVPSRPIKPLPRRASGKPAAPKIVVLDEKENV